MSEIIITCDRCGKVVHGLINKTPDGHVITGGYYDVTDPYWGQFSRWEEEKICDSCMHSDPRYKKIYNT